MVTEDLHVSHSDLLHALGPQSQVWANSQAGLGQLWPWESEPFRNIRPRTVKNYPFSEDSRNTLIAKGVFGKDGLVSAGFIPCWINDEGQPEPVTREGKGAEVIAYMKNWIERSAISTELNWNEEGTEIVFDLSRNTGYSGH